MVLGESYNAKLQINSYRHFERQNSMSGNTKLIPMAPGRYIVFLKWNYLSQPYLEQYYL